MKKIMTIVLLGMCLSIQVFGESFFNYTDDSYVSQNDQQLLPAGHWVYDSLVMLAFETGITSMAVSAPLSMAEIRGNLEDIPYDRLSSQGQQEYRRIVDVTNERWLGVSSKVLSLGIAPSLNPEAFIKTDEDVNWFYDYYKRSPIISMPFRLSAANIFTAETDLYLGQNYWTMAEHDNRVNIPLAANAIDANFPKRSSLSAGNSFFNFHIGMGEMDAGRSQTGNLLLSRYMIGASYAQFSLFSPRIRYSANIIEMNVNKYLYLHRLEFRPLKRLSIAIIEGVMVNAPLELRFLNPFSIFHGMASWRDYADYNSGQVGASKDDGYDPDESRVGSSFALHIDVNPWKYIRLYGQFAMNQFQTSYERENYSEAAAAIPNSIAFLGGFESWIPMAKTGYLYLGAEGVYTSPWMYTLQNKGWSYYRSWRELVSPDTSEYINNWTGSPFGPDSIAVQAKIGWKIPGKYAVYAGWRMWINGEIDSSIFDNADYYPSTAEEAVVSTPTGTAVYDNRLFVNGDWDVTPWLNLGSTISAGWIENKDHDSGKNAFSMEFALNAKIKFY
jgi:hypothetical protein